MQIPVKVDLPVGHNLQDHVGALMGPFHFDAPISIKIERNVTPLDLLRYFSGSEGTGLSSSPAQASAFMVSRIAKERGQENWPDNQHILVGAAVFDYNAEIYSRTFNTRMEVLEKYFKASEQKDSVQVINMVSRPFSRGTIKLQGTDPFLPPLVDPNYFSDERDMRVAIEGAKRAVSMFENTETFKAINGTLTPTPLPGCEHLTIKTDEYWECFHRQYSFTVYHPVGTCAMGRKDSKDAVVDSELRVIGTKNLRVVDASIMPRVTTGNTNAPTIMIGEMGANFIKSAWDFSGEGWGQCEAAPVGFPKFPSSECVH